MLKTTQQEQAIKVLLVNLIFSNYLSINNKLEFFNLARSGNFLVADSIDCKINKNFLNPKYLIGKGQLNNILLKLNQDLNLVIFNCDLSASQQKHLEQFLSCKVLDRTELILHIFAQRARSFEGKLQVELARLQHLSTRLVRVWTHLERQRGGAGLRGGPGEQQLEIDRRIIKKKLANITGKLKQIKQQRRLHRERRNKSGLLIGSLVGYTNSGKSTLFNLLTRSNVTTLDLPFVTLDPTTRSIMVPKIGNFMLTDTVGFIQNLPHHLIDAFKATLEEITASDLLLHVIDFSDPNALENKQHVLKVLEQIGASQIPILEVYNKIDLIREDQALNVEEIQDLDPAQGSCDFNLLVPTILQQAKLNRSDQMAGSQITDLEHNCWQVNSDRTIVGNYGVKISALNGTGIQELLQEISKVLCSDLVYCKLRLLPKYASIREELIRIAAVDHEYIDPITGEFQLDLSLNKKTLELLCSKFKDLPKILKQHKI